MNITREDFIEVLERLDKEINNRDGHITRACKEMGDEWNPAYQMAIAAFVTEKGNKDDLDLLREYFKEAYGTGSDLSVEFK